VSLRRRSARRMRMVDSSVSGKVKKRTTKAKPEIHRSSSAGQRQFMPSAAKPPMTGPAIGPQTAPIAAEARHQHEEEEEEKEEDEEEGGRTPCTDGDGELLGRVDVAHARTSSRESRRADHAREEAEDEDGRDVLGEDLGDLEDDEEGEADDVDGQPAPSRNLLHGREEHCEARRGEEESARRARRRGEGRRGEEDALGAMPYPKTKRLKPAVAPTWPTPNSSMMPGIEEV